MNKIGEVLLDELMEILNGNRKHYAWLLIVIFAVCLLLFVGFNAVLVRNFFLNN